MIVDWKRSKEIKKTNRWQHGKSIFQHLEDCNYIHYTLQLNIYRHILETKYNKKIIDMFLVVCHPTYTTSEIHPIKFLPSEISALWTQLPLKL
jgi:catalase